MASQCTGRLCKLDECCSLTIYRRDIKVISRCERSAGTCQNRVLLRDPSRGHVTALFPARHFVHPGWASLHVRIRLNPSWNHSGFTETAWSLWTTSGAGPAGPGRSSWRGTSSWPLQLRVWVINHACPTGSHWLQQCTYRNSSAKAASKTSKGHHKYCILGWPTYQTQHLKRWDVLWILFRYITWILWHNENLCIM